VYFVTGEFQFIGAAVKSHFQTAGYRSSRAEVKDGLLTGRITRSFANREAKARAVAQLLRRHGVAGSAGFGDSEGDIGMLEQVAHRACIDATPGLAAHAKGQGWEDWLVEPREADVMDWVHRNLG
jgi:phosphoserine phosphatase